MSDSPVRVPREGQPLAVVQTPVGEAVDIAGTVIERIEEEPLDQRVEPLLGGRADRVT